MSLGPAILGGRIRFLSVSQLEKFDERVDGGCNRAWWFRYVARQKDKDAAPAKLGKQLHRQIEHYLKTGQRSLGPLVQAGARFLPRPGVDLLVEYPFGRLYELAPGGYYGPLVSLLSAAGVPFTGQVDLMHLRGEWVNDDGELLPAPGVPEIVDWKTTKQIDDVIDERTGEVKRKGWAKKTAEIVKGWQAAGYAKLAFTLWPEADTARVGHGYFQTEGTREASKRSAIVTRSETQKLWAGADELVCQMKQVATLERIEDVKPNYDACKSYGGCPYQEQCPRNPKLIMASMLKTRR